MPNGCPVYYYVKAKRALKQVTHARCIFRHTRRAKAHYYADRKHYACTGRVFLCSRTHAITHTPRATDENIYGAGFRTIIGFPLDRILFHSSAAYPRTTEARPITDTFLRWHIETYCRRYVSATGKAYSALPATMGVLLLVCHVRKEKIYFPHRCVQNSLLGN